MPAMIGPVRFNFLTPGTLKPRPVADSAQGICTQPLQAAACCGVNGASEAPKSTVRAVIWAIPAPEPTAPYLTGMPSLISKPLIQLAINCATSVEPAPVRAAATPATLDGPRAARTRAARPRKQADRIGDAVLYGVCLLAALLSVAVIALIGYQVVHGASPAISKFGLGFLTNTTWQPN